MSRLDHGPTLAHVVDGRENGFNAVRLLAAAAVVVSHSYAMIGAEHASEPLWGITPYTLGQHAVNVFFVLSGLMLSRSYALDPRLWRFAVARILRVFPGLIACGLVVAALIGALGTRLPLASYFADPATLAYPLRVAVEFNRATLPAVFEHGTYAGSPNGSLWTIKYELMAYAAFVAAAAFGLVRSKAVAIVAVVLLTGAVIGLQLLPAVVDRWPALVPPGRFFLSFALGVAAYRYRERISLRWLWLAAFLVLAVAAHETVLEQPAYIVLTGYLALMLGSVTAPAVSRFSARTDLSYGLYLYAWPVQQLLLHRWPALDPVPHILLTLCGAIPLAATSWRLVERPALDLKRLLHRGPPPALRPPLQPAGSS